MTKGLKGATKRLADGFRLDNFRGVNKKAARRLRLKLTAGRLPANLVLVSNATGTAGKKCKCGCKDWSAHWARKTGIVLKTRKCFVRGCGKKAVLGAHVHVQGKGNRQMILPFCSFHNNRALTIALPLKKKTMLSLAVPAYVQLP